MRKEDSVPPARSGAAGERANRKPLFSRIGALMNAGQTVVPDMRRGSTLFAMSLAASVLALAVWTSWELAAAPDEPYAATSQYAGQAVSEY